jgi:hypothetical protein
MAEIKEASLQLAQQQGELQAAVAALERQRAARRTEIMEEEQVREDPLGGTCALGGLGPPSCPLLNLGLQCSQQNSFRGIWSAR